MSNTAQQLEVEAVTVDEPSAIVAETEGPATVVVTEDHGETSVLVAETEALKLADGEIGAEDEGRIADEYADSVYPDEPVEDHAVNGDVGSAPHDPIGNDKLALGTALPTTPLDTRNLEWEEHQAEQAELEHQHALESQEAEAQRPGALREPSRSYIKPIPIVTTYETEEAKPSSRAPTINRSQSGYVSNAGTRPASRLDNTRPASRLDNTRPASRATSRAETTNAAAAIPAPVLADVGRSASRASVTTGAAPTTRPVSRAQSHKPSSIKSASIREKTGRPTSVRAPSRATSVRETGYGRQQRASGPPGVGEVMTFERQRQLQQPGSPQEADYARPYDQSSHGRSTSPRPASAFGHRPQPNLIAVVEDGRESRYEPDSRAGVLGRSGTVMSRGNTLGRNGTLSRAANGGTVGGRRGAFGRGAGTSIGTQPEEVLGRE